MEDIVPNQKIHLSEIKETEKVNIQKLSEDERMEYAQIGENYRHHNIVAYQFGAILLPLSIGAAVIALQFPKTKYALVFFSIAIYIYWQLACVRVAWQNSLILTRARELEIKAGLIQYNYFVNPPLNMTHELGYHISIRKMRWIYLILLLLSWIIILWILK